MEATFFDSTGRFVGVLISTDEAGFALTVQNRYYVDSIEDGEKSYYDMASGEVLPRPAMSVVQAGNRLSGLPQPCRVHINGEAYDVDDGIFEYETTLAGTYFVTVEAFPWLDWKGEIIIESSASPQ